MPIPGNLSPENLVALISGILFFFMLQYLVHCFFGYVQFRYTSRIRIALAPPSEPEDPKAKSKPKASQAGVKRRAARPAMA